MKKLVKPYFGASFIQSWDVCRDESGQLGSTLIVFLLSSLHNSATVFILFVVTGKNNMFCHCCWGEWVEHLFYYM